MSTHSRTDIHGKAGNFIYKFRLNRHTNSSIITKNKNSQNTYAVSTQKNPAVNLSYERFAAKSLPHMLCDERSSVMNNDFEIASVICPCCGKSTTTRFLLCSHCGVPLNSSEKEVKKHRIYMKLSKIFLIAPIIMFAVGFLMAMIFEPEKVPEYETLKIEYVEHTNDLEENTYAYADLVYADALATLEQIETKNGVKTSKAGVETDVYYQCLIPADENFSEETFDDYVLIVKVKSEEKEIFEKKISESLDNYTPYRVYGKKIGAPIASTYPGGTELEYIAIQSAKEAGYNFGDYEEIEEQKKQNDETMEYLKAHSILEINTEPQYERQVFLGMVRKPIFYFIYALMIIGGTMLFARVFIKKKINI